MVKSARFGAETYLLRTISSFELAKYLARVGRIFPASTVSHTCVYLSAANVVTSLEGPFRLYAGSKLWNQMKEKDPSGADWLPFFIITPLSVDAICRIKVMKSNHHTALINKKLSMVKFTHMLSCNYPFLHLYKSLGFESTHRFKLIFQVLLQLLGRLKVYFKELKDLAGTDWLLYN